MEGAPILLTSLGLGLSFSLAFAINHPLPPKHLRGTTHEI